MLSEDKRAIGFSIDRLGADPKSSPAIDRSASQAVAAQAMRNVLVDYARSRYYKKRGGGVRAVSLDEAALL